jgi:hypothetical protein
MGAAKDERAPRITDFGRRLTGFLRSWVAIGMDLGLQSFTMQLLMLMFYIGSFSARHTLRIGGEEPRVPIESNQTK